MQRKLILKAQADLDIVGHYIYLLGRNVEAADRFKRSVKAAKQRIRKDSRGCPTLALPEFEYLELRFCRPTGFENYLMIFQVTDEGSIVLRVLHGSQDIVEALRGHT